MRAVVIVALMACAAAPTAVVTNHATNSHAPPSLFAPLFRDGASWRFTAETKITDDNGHHEVRPGAVTCAVSQARESSNMWIARLACSGIETDQPIDVTLVATEAGLWHFDREPGALTPETMAIAAQPRDGTQHHRDLGGGESESYAVTRVGDHWCFTYNTNQGDDRAWMLCIREQAGIVGGSSYFLGGQTKLTSFGDAQ